MKDAINLLEAMKLNECFLTLFFQSVNYRRDLQCVFFNDKIERPFYRLDYCIIVYKSLLIKVYTV